MASRPTYRACGAGRAAGFRPIPRLDLHSPPAPPPRPRSCAPSVQVRVARARAKKFNVGSPFEDEAKFEASVAKVEKLEKKIEAIGKKYGARYSDKVRPSRVRTHTSTLERRAVRLARLPQLRLARGSANTRCYADHRRVRDVQLRRVPHPVPGGLPLVALGMWKETSAAGACHRDDASRGHTDPWSSHAP